MFLNLETQAVPMHIGALMLLDAPKAPHFSYEAVVSTLANRLHLIPAFRRRVIFPPLNLIRPYWIEDPDFRISRHVLRSQLPAPGGEREIAAAVARIIEQPLKRDRPLWEFHYIEGLADGRVACVMKIHHACADGISGTDLFAQVLDTTQEVPVLDTPLWEPDEMPSLAALNWMTARSVLLAPRVLRHLVRETYDFAKDFMASDALGGDKLSHDAQIVAEQEQALNAPSAPTRLLAPRTRFNATIDAAREYAYTSLSMAAVIRLKQQFNCSINDVVLALCGEVIRHYLIDLGELPDAPLQAAVPMSVRDKDEAGGRGGNKVIISRVTLGTDIADPVERLKTIARRMGRIKRVGKKLPAKLMMDWVNMPAPALFFQAARLYEGLSLQDYVSLPANLVVSNVPGPPEKLFFAGARLSELYPVSIPYHGLALNITLLSYGGRLHFGFTAHPGAVPDLAAFPAMFERALKALQRKARLCIDEGESGTPPGPFADPLAQAQASDAQMRRD
jgi:diacylglycerol O-acyltransferase